MTIFNIIILYPQGEKALKELKEYEKEKENENTKRKAFETMSVVIVYGSGMFCDNQCQDDNGRHHRGRSNQMAEPYMESIMTIHLIRYCIKSFGRYRQFAKSSRYLIYRFSYGKKLYFSSADDEGTGITCTYTKGKNIQFYDPVVDVVYDGDDYKFEISLEPKDPCCFGFKVVYHNGSFLLLQNIESIDIPFLLFVEHLLCADRSGSGGDLIHGSFCYL